jgi:hypothetical protein
MGTTRCVVSRSIREYIWTLIACMGTCQLVLSLALTLGHNRHFGYLQRLKVVFHVVDCIGLHILFAGLHILLIAKNS